MKTYYHSPQNGSVEYVDTRPNETRKCHPRDIRIVSFPFSAPEIQALQWQIAEDIRATQGVPAVGRMQGALT